MSSRPCRHLMAVAALCLLLLASSPGSLALVGELIGVIALVAGLGLLGNCPTPTPIPTNHAQ
jgi:hypothetical protein